MFYQSPKIAPPAYNDPYYRRYPFLSSIVGDHPVLRINPSGMNLTVLEMGALDPTVYDELGHVSNVRIMFINDKNTIVGEVQPSKYVRQTKGTFLRRLFSRKHYQPGETVYSALKRLSDKIPEIRFILITRQKDMLYSSVEIFELSKDFNLDSWITQQESEVRYSPPHVS